MTAQTSPPRVTTLARDASGQIVGTEEREVVGAYCSPLAYLAARAAEEDRAADTADGSGFWGSRCRERAALIRELIEGLRERGCA